MVEDEIGIPVAVHIPDRHLRIHPGDDSRGIVGSQSEGSVAQVQKDAQGVGFYVGNHDIAVTVAIEIGNAELSRVVESRVVPMLAKGSIAASKDYTARIRTRYCARNVGVPVAVQIANRDAGQSAW